MNNKAVFIILVVFYLSLVAINSMRVSNTGANYIPPLIIMGLLFLGYSVMSIILTVQLKNAGAFNWIAASVTTRNIILILSIAAILYSVFSAITIKSDWTTYRQQSITNPIDFLTFTSYIWAPLLMIIPYALAIFKGEQALSKGIAYKLPLIINVVIGIGMYGFFHMPYFKALLAPRVSDHDYFINQTVDKISYQHDIKDYLLYADVTYDRRIIDAVFKKIKADSTFENQVYTKLQSCNDLNSMKVIHYFLANYTFDNPQKLITPFSQSLSCIAAEIAKFDTNEYVYETDLNKLYLEKILSAIEKQFPEQEKIFFEDLDEIEKAIRKLQKDVAKRQVVDILAEIQNFKAKY